MSEDKEQVCCECQEAMCNVLRVIEENKGDPGALIQVLHFAQEQLGYVPKEIQVKVADTLGVSLSDVYGVITFYGIFRERPRGKYIISACLGTACYVRGAPDVLARFEKELGVKAGDSTDDGIFTLEVVRCLGACGLAPVITVNKDTYGRMSGDKVPAIIKTYRAKAKAEEQEVAVD